MLIEHKDFFKIITIKDCLSFNQLNCISVMIDHLVDEVLIILLSDYNQSLFINKYIYKACGKPVIWI